MSNRVQFCRLVGAVLATTQLAALSRHNKVAMYKRPSTSTQPAWFTFSCTPSSRVYKYTRCDTQNYYNNQKSCGKPMEIKTGRY